jgi:hypothetical protein
MNENRRGRIIACHQKNMQEKWDDHDTGIHG